MSPESPLPAENASRKKAEADREYERKLDRDLRILRIAFPVMCVVTAVLTIVTTIVVIVTKL